MAFVDNDDGNEINAPTYTLSEIEYDNSFVVVSFSEPVTLT